MLLPSFACWIAWAFSPFSFLFHTLSPFPHPGLAAVTGRGWGSTLSHQGLLQSRDTTSIDSVVITWALFPSLTLLHGILTAVCARFGQLHGFNVLVRVRSGAQQHRRRKAVPPCTQQRELGCSATPGRYQSLWLCDKGFYLFPLSATLQCRLSPCKDQKGFTWQHTQPEFAVQELTVPENAVLLGKDHFAQTNSVKSLVTLCCCSFFGICFCY